MDRRQEGRRILDGAQESLGARGLCSHHAIRTGLNRLRRSPPQHPLPPPGARAGRRAALLPRRPPPHGRRAGGAAVRLERPRPTPRLEAPPWLQVRHRERGAPVRCTGAGVLKPAAPRAFRRRRRDRRNLAHPRGRRGGRLRHQLLPRLAAPLQHRDPAGSSAPLQAAVGPNPQVEQRELRGRPATQSPHRPIGHEHHGVDQRTQADRRRRRRVHQRLRCIWSL